MPMLASDHHPLATNQYCAPQALRAGFMNGDWQIRSIVNFDFPPRSAEPATEDATDEERRRGPVPATLSEREDLDTGAPRRAAVSHLRGSVAEEPSRNHACGLQEWLVPDDENVSENNGEAEAPSAGDLSGEPLHGIRKVLDSMRDKMTYYLVDWEPTWEPRSNLSLALIAQFTQQRRVLVRHIYIEDEAT